MAAALGAGGCGSSGSPSGAVGGADTRSPGGRAGQDATGGGAESADGGAGDRAEPEGGAGRGGSAGSTSAGTGNMSGGLTGTSGSANSGPSAHCQPGETLQTYPYDVEQPCYGDRFAYHLPNAADIQLSDFRLDVPTTAGERFAYSVRHVGAGPFEIEVWGAHEQCGVAEELLWRGPMKDGIQCGEFVPSASYSHLLYVYRKQEKKSYSFSMPELTLCNAGSCPTGAEGQGLEPGAPVTPAPLVFEDPIVGRDRQSFDLGLNVYGHALLLLDGVKQPKGTPNQLAQGVLRMAPDDRFGDGWYCIGKDSTVTEFVNDPGVFEYVTLEVSLKHLTRLPNCSTKQGTGSASFVVGPDGTTVTSSFGDIVPTLPYADEQSCLGTSCKFLIADSQSGGPKRWMFVTPVASVGDYFKPTAVPTNLASAILFNRTDSALPLKISCAQSGSLTYNPAGTTQLSLEGMSDYFACPGEPVEDDQLEFKTL